MNRKVKSAAMKVSLCAIGLWLIGCVSLPPQSAELSAMMGRQIAQARKHDANMIDAFVLQSQKLIDERMRYYWIPRIIKEMLVLENSEGKTFDDAVCEEEGQMDRALEVQSFIKAVNARVMERRKKFQRPLNKEERNLRKAHREGFDYLERMSMTLTENLQSVLKTQERRDKVLKAWNLPTDIATPINEATDRINKLLEAD